jgi:hypothetical protein
MPVQFNLESKIVQPYPKLQIYISELYYKHSIALGL